MRKGLRHFCFTVMCFVAGMKQVDWEQREVGSCKKPQQESKWSEEEAMELTEHDFHTQWPGIHLGADADPGQKHGTANVALRVLPPLPLHSLWFGHSFLYVFLKEYAAYMLLGLFKSYFKCYLISLCVVLSCKASSDWLFAAGIPQVNQSCSSACRERGKHDSFHCTVAWAHEKHSAFLDGKGPCISSSTGTELDVPVWWVHRYEKVNFSWLDSTSVPLM